MLIQSFISPTHSCCLCLCPSWHRHSALAPFSVGMHSALSGQISHSAFRNYENFFLYLLSCEFSVYIQLYELFYEKRIMLEYTRELSDSKEEIINHLHSWSHPPQMIHRRCSCMIHLCWCMLHSHDSCSYPKNHIRWYLIGQVGSVTVYAIFKNIQLVVECNGIENCLSSPQYWRYMGAAGAFLFPLCEFVFPVDNFSKIWIADGVAKWDSFKRDRLVRKQASTLINPFPLTERHWLNRLLGHQINQAVR